MKKISLFPDYHRNFLQNLSTITNTPQFAFHKNNFLQSAIIIGAGKSLEETIAKLNPIRFGAILIAHVAALERLLAIKIEPDIVIYPYSFNENEPRKYKAVSQLKKSFVLFDVRSHPEDITSANLPFAFPDWYGEELPNSFRNFLSEKITPSWDGISLALSLSNKLGVKKVFLAGCEMTDEKGKIKVKTWSKTAMSTPSLVIHLKEFNRMANYISKHHELKIFDCHSNSAVKANTVFLKNIVRTHSTLSKRKLISKQNTLPPLAQSNLLKRFTTFKNISLHEFCNRFSTGEFETEIALLQPPWGAHLLAMRRAGLPINEQLLEILYRTLKSTLTAKDKL